MAVHLRMGKTIRAVIGRVMEMVQPKSDTPIHMGGGIAPGILLTGVEDVVRKIWWAPAATATFTALRLIRSLS
ncbi:MAG: hypothetical protein Ct9H300mP25_08720 [Acidobacteriota bacterium]|nr:MAG: hypothetical protein Ct9H300mP25_08720 [Acidobacteriota bacterium]